jgi:hypothetical protein
VDTGSGDDLVRGGSGDDEVFAPAGANTVLLEQGDDRVTAVEGDNDVDAGPGDDVCDLREGTHTAHSCETFVHDGWEVDNDPPGRSGDSSLYVASKPSRDAGIVRELSIDGPLLSFAAGWNLETGYDVGAVQVSTDGGTSYESVACTDSVDSLNSDATSDAVELLPAFTGASGGFATQECNLSGFADAAKPVLLAFHLFADQVAEGEPEEGPTGFWVDQIKLGDRTLSDGSSLDGWHPQNVILK